MAVYGCEPRVGEMVSKFSGAYPFLLVQQMASGLAQACRGKVGRISPEVRARSLKEVGLPEAFEPATFCTEDVFSSRPWFATASLSERCFGTDSRSPGTSM